MLKVYDTSALLNLKEELVLDEDTYIPFIVLKELEEIKTSVRKDEQTKYYARKIVSALQEYDVKTDLISNKKIGRLMRRHEDALVDNHDSRIILETKLLSEKYPGVVFRTGDRCQYLLIRKLFPHITTQYIEDVSSTRIPSGYRYIVPTEEEWVKLYNPDNNENIWQCYTNEYVILTDEDTNVKEIARWDGEGYVRLGYESVFTDICGRIEPRNTEQKLYFDALQNPNVPIISTISTAGTGKSYLAFLNGLAALEKGEYNRIVYIRNNYEVTQTKEVGFLEGSLQKKTEWLLAPIVSIVGQDYLDRLIQEGKFEYIHLAFIRGTTLGPNDYVIVDEAQNLSRGLIKTIISRIGEGTKVVFCGDFSQRDSQLFSRDSGVMAMSKALTGNPNFAQIRLKKVERSNISMLAEKI